MKPKLNLTKLLDQSMLKKLNEIPDFKFNYCIAKQSILHGLKESSLSRFKKIDKLGYLFYEKNQNVMCLIRFQDEKACFYINRYSVIYITP